eukprot:3497151-Rhodomonas_salina.1
MIQPNRRTSETRAAYVGRSCPSLCVRMGFLLLRLLLLLSFCSSVPPPFASSSHTLLSFVPQAILLLLSFEPPHVLPTPFLSCPRRYFSIMATSRLWMESMRPGGVGSPGSQRVCDLDVVMQLDGAAPLERLCPRDHPDDADGALMKLFLVHDSVQLEASTAPG